jgi:hypothetical protein
MYMHHKHILVAAVLTLCACTEAPETQQSAKPADQTQPVANSEKPAASTTSSFCTAAETIVFTCLTGAKQVSVCASRTVSPTAGYVQYRFGAAGAAGAAGKSGAPLEIAHPPGQVHPLKAAYGSSETFSGGGGAWMRFRNPPYAYVVYSGIGHWGPNGEPISKEGVVIEKDGATVSHLKCNGNSSGELGPDWLDKAGYTDNSNEQFEFPD